MQLHGKTATGIPVPDEVIEALGSSKRPPVAVTINGHTYRTTAVRMGGRFLVPLSAENRAGAGVEAGQEIDVDIEFDDAPRTVDVPADLAAALSATGRAAFDALSVSRRKAIVGPIEDAKTPETRARRIAKSVGELG